MADFGYKTIGTAGNAAIENKVFGSLYTITEDGTADSITVALAYLTTQSTWTVRCAIYKHSDLSFVGETEERSITPNLTYDWYTFNFSAPKPSLVSGTGYILVAWANSLAGFIILARDAGDTDQDHRDDETYNSFPSTFVVDNHYDLKTSIYCTYTPAPVVIAPGGNVPQAKVLEIIAQTKPKPLGFPKLKSFSSRFPKLNPLRI